MTTLHVEGNAITLEAVEKKPGEVRFKLNGKAYHFTGQRLVDGSVVLEDGLRKLGGTVAATSKGGTRVQLGALEAKVSPALAGAASSGTVALSPVAPMPGAVRQVLVKKGDKVTKGQALVMLEAMKLQLTLSAGSDGKVEAVLVKEGEMVAEGAELVRVVP